MADTPGLDLLDGARRFFVTGGAGFIGSHLVEALLRLPQAEVVVYDNFSSGRRWHLETIPAGVPLTVVERDLKDLDRLVAAMTGADAVFHLASNPDIAKAETEPAIDFWEGTYLTQNVLEAMRRNRVRWIVYASGSGVYGDRGDTELAEDAGPFLPISTYGASKLAGEALIGAYCHMFELSGRAFRFANVVGPRQTHGVVYDFVRRLLAEPTHLQILGDGSQSKSYIHVDDIVQAMLTVGRRGSGGFDAFNVATLDYQSVREIADLVIDRLRLSDVRYEFTGGARGWKGDVPVVRFDTAKIRALGWVSRYSSREALLHAADAIIAHARGGTLEHA